MKKAWILLIGILAALRLTAQDARVQQVLGQIKNDSLLLELRKLTGELSVVVNGQTTTIATRFYNTPGNALAYRYLKQRLVSFGLSVDSLVFSANGKNLFGIKKGSIFPERVCMIGAHYDNLPPGTVAPGADDNASGCVAVLEAARILSAVELPNTVVFAFWDEEELGLLGSAAYATQFAATGDSLLCYVNLDMLGWDSNNDFVTEIHARNSGNSVAMAEQAQQCNDRYNLGLTIQSVHPGSVNTDHFPFWQNGLTAIGINEEYTGDVNPHRHLVSDSLETLNLPYFYANVRLALAAFSELAWNKSGALPDGEILAGATVFPNPFAEKLVVAFPQATNAAVTAKLYENTGKLAFSVEYTPTDGFAISTATLRKGLYFLHLSTADSHHMVPVVKY